MRRNGWWVLAGLMIGLLLGGVRCSVHIDQSPTPPDPTPQEVPDGGR